MGQADFLPRSQGILGRGILCTESGKMFRGLGRHPDYTNEYGAKADSCSI